MKCIKEKIFVDFGGGDGMSLTYHLSNSLDDIKETIYKTTGCLIDLNEIYWTLNHELSESVTDLMNKYNVDYSMVFFEGITVNRRIGDSWYIYQGTNINKEKNIYSKKNFPEIFEYTKQQKNKGSKE